MNYDHQMPNIEKKTPSSATQTRKEGEGGMERERDAEEHKVLKNALHED